MTKLHPWLRTLLSLVLYVSVYYLIFRDLRSIALLVLVIVIHELGHYLAMRAYGYSNLQMLFVPLLGAYVSGQPSQVDPGKKLIVLFAGPVPGLVLGVLFGMLYSHGHGYIYYLMSLMFILLNLFNLVPVSPLDGGQILATLFPRHQRILQTVFIFLAAAAVTFAMVVYDVYFLAVLLLLLASRLFSIWKHIDREEDGNKIAGPLLEPGRNEKLMFTFFWLLAIAIPLQTVFRII